MLYRLVIVLGFAVASLVAGPVSGNGWEHLAIPRDALLKALHSDEPHLMAHAARSMGVRGEARDVPPLLHALEHAEGSTHLRASIYGALGQIGDPRGTPALIAALETESREELRADAAIALGQIGDARALPALLTALETDERTVRLRAADALGAFDTSESVAALAQITRESGDEALRRAAFRALGQTGAAEAASPLLEALHANVDPRNLAVVVDAVGKLAPLQAKTPLTRLLDETESPHLRAKITAALGAIDDGDVTPTLVMLLEDESHGVRMTALKQLHEDKAEAAAEPIAALYRSLASTRPIQDEPALPADPFAYLADLELMDAALRALIDLAPEASLAELLDGAMPRSFPRNSAIALKLSRSAYELRRLAVFGLGYTESKTASAYLTTDILGSDDPRLRAAAVRALGVLGKPGVVQEALAALQDPDGEVRSNAAVVLGRHGGQDVVPALIGALDDANTEVRLQAANSLGYLGAHEAREPLNRLATSAESEKVATAAREALALIPAAE